MNGFKLFGKEMQDIVNNKKILISIIAILFVPLIYSGMFLWSFKDPYANMGELPVAVVNNDIGATMDGDSLQLGNDLVDNLKESKAFDFHFVSEKEAENGMDDLKYYMTIEIPEDFSENATTLMDESPKKLQLKYISNDSYNFLSSQIGETAVSKIQKAMSTEVSKTYAETLFDKATEMADGFKSASDGSEKLDNGAVQVQDGAEDLKDNLELLASKSVEFKNGMDAAQVGTSPLAAGMTEANEGIQEIKGKLPDLIDGTNQVSQGINKFQTIFPQQFATAMSGQLIGESSKMMSGLDTLNSQIDSGLKDQLAPQLASGLSQATAAQVANMITATPEQQMVQLKAMLTPAIGTDKTQKIIQGLSTGSLSPEDKLDLQKGLQIVFQTSFSSGINSGVNTTIAGINGGFKTYEEGITSQLTADNLESQIAGAINPSLNEISAGLGAIQKGQQALQSGIGELSVGTGKLANGANELNNGMEKLADGSSQLSGGAAQLAEGAGQLSTGTDDLRNGTNELSTKLKDAADQAGGIKANDKTYDMMSSPVEMDTEHANYVPNYGTGFAPYFMSLGLFVGALLITIIFPLIDSAGIPKNGFSWFFSKFGVMALIGIIQAALTGSIVLWGLNIEVQNIPLFFLFTLITSWTFIALVQFLVTLGNNPGRFVAILILIAQLTSSAGTFPLEVIPKAVQWFNPLLPMTYSVRGFKAVISSGDFGFMWQNIGVLFAYIVGSVLITIGYFIWKHNKVYKMDQTADQREPKVASM